MKQRIYKYWVLFITFLRIGLFTFGGGYAMIPLIQKEIVDKKKWLAEQELLDVLIVAESTPGPISVNTATYVGFKVAGVLGSVFATLGLVLPSFVIIYIISLFFDDFLKIKWVQSAFLGIQAAVAVLIISAGVKLIKDSPKNIYNVIAIIVVLFLSLLLKFLDINLSSIIFILFGGAIGLIFYLVELIIKDKNEKIFDANDSKGDDK